MERSIRLFIGLGFVGMLILLGLIAWIYFSFPAARERPPAAPVVLATLPPTETPKATETTFFFATATPVPPTPTHTPTVTQTPEDTATATATNVPFVRPRPTSTATPLPSATPTVTPVPPPYSNVGAPVPDASRVCKGGFYLYGTVRDSQGRGLANVRLRYLKSLPGPLVIFDRTRSGTEAGYYEFYVGLFGNDVDMTIVDEAENALSPTVHVSLSGTNCWWVLNWARNS
jgi:hypothetical protein